MMARRLALVAALLAPAVAAARPVNARFFLDGAAGVAIPISDGFYRDQVDPSFKLSLRLGAELWLSRRIGLAPEGALDLEPLQLRDHAGVHTVRVRGLVGLRFLIGFGRGHAFFLRFLVGVDHVADVNGNARATSFGLEPGFGMQFRVLRRMVVGFAVDFPVSWHPEFTLPAQVDADFLFFVGLRL